MKVTLFPREESLGFWIYRVQSQASALLRKVFQAAGYDMTSEQYFVLLRVTEEEGMNQNQLCEKTYKDRHNMTRILNVLERHGYVERRADETDRRAYRIFSTESGRHTRDKVTPIVLGYLEGIFKGLEEQDVAGARKVLERVVRNIEGMPFSR